MIPPSEKSQDTASWWLYEHVEESPYTPPPFRPISPSPEQNPRDLSVMKSPPRISMPLSVLPIAHAGGNGPCWQDAQIIILETSSSKPAATTQGQLETTLNQSHLCDANRPTRAPLIALSEIVFTKCYSLRKWAGYWKGREVDVRLSFNDDKRATNLMHREMAGHLALQGLDITYEVLGHVAQSDGKIIGLMTESEAGRPIQYGDRAKVYEALARVQHRGLVFCGAQEYSNIHILDGKLRLTNLATVWYFPEPTTREEQGILHHWNVMESLFAALRARARNSDQIVGWSPGGRLIRSEGLTLLPTCSPMWALSVSHILKDARLVERIKRWKEVLDMVRRLGSADKKQQGATAKIPVERSPYWRFDVTLCD